jgi:radical SAM protein with 4Fe4S-binding SPASM domain
MTVNKELIDKIISCGLKLPEILTLAITGRCNLNCPHCLLDCMDSSVLPVPANIIKRIIREFSEIGGKRLFLTGGEPFLHPDWPDIFKFAFAQTGLIEIGMQTNAVLLSEKDISTLLSFPADRLSLQVSLDGSSAETNDAVRGKGSFEAVMKALTLLSAKGLGKCTGITFTEMRHNYHELPDIIELVHKLGLKNLVSNTLVKAGRSSRYEWISLPEPSQVKLLIDKYCSDPVFHNLYEKYGSISAIEWFKGSNISTELVCNCITTPYISADGKLFPCAMYLSNLLAVSGVHEKSLKAAIAEGISGWAKLPKISRQRMQSLSECKDCPGHAHCAGGCLGRADAVNGSALTIEDRCSLRKTVYAIRNKNKK